ncbi:MAG: alpha/beta fold hydrolase [Pseudomonadota bacterium]
MSRLTVARLFADPPLYGQLPEDLRFAPHADFITYRARGLDDGERMDLWRVLKDGTHECYVDAREISAEHPQEAAISAEEQAERERRRQFTNGINQYQWHPLKPWLLIPLDGQAHLCDMRETEAGVAVERQWHALCPPATRQSAMQFSPQGNFISYVRGGELFLLALPDDLEHLDTLTEQQLTHDAQDTLTNGLADFLAAEEMHRFEGYWWSKDEQYLAYCKVDDAPVEVSYRLQVDAGNAHTVAQRYPYPGKDNPAVALHLYHIPSGQDRCIWRSPADDAYLARVQADVNGFIVQTQDRLQQHLHIRHYNPATQAWRQLYHEQAQTWINLTNDLHVLDDQRVVLSSESQGTRQVLVLQEDKPQPLSGPTHINQLIRCTHDAAYATGWDQTATENHLYRIALDGSGYTQITKSSGWHEISLNQACTHFIDRYSNETTPLQVTLCDLQGKRPAMAMFSQSFTEDHPYTPYVKHHVHGSFGEIEAADGQTLHYRLTPPAQINGQHATIVYVYGGPGAQKVRREWSPLLLQLFAQQGFAVLELDNRGSTNRGRLFEAPLYRNMGSIEVVDQVRGLQVLEQYDWADPQRVGLFGHSYGGYMTLMGLSQAPEHFRAGVAVAPVCDWQLYDTHYTERYMGLPNDNPDGYQQANVLSHLDKLQAPLLLIHGMADDNVLFTHSTMIMSALQAQGSAFELMTYPGAKHALQERHVAEHRFNLILDFFQRTLQP